MGLDTKYRPSCYADVLGQDQTIRICKEIVRRGVGFHQSYMFHGPFGTGKTTLGRILAKALLCQNPQGGEACGSCHSCESFVQGVSESFVEFDAATNSGKEDIRRLLDDINYNTFSGSRRIYLVDESHELSRQAMDALLKPLEQTWPNSLEKQLVCIFCTTEPDKMRPAILSRCAPAFRIQSNTPQQIAGRMETICLQEGIPYEKEALQIIAEVKECHIRDCLKALEALHVMGGATVASVRQYLHLGVHEVILDLVESLGGDEERIVRGLEELEKHVSPSSAYQRLAEVCLLAYKVHTYGASQIPSYLPKDRLQALGRLKGERLLDAARTFAERPFRASYVMLGCDLLTVGKRRREVVREEETVPEPPPEPTPEGKGPSEGVTSTGVFWTSDARNRRGPCEVSPAKGAADPSMDPQAFLQVFMKEYDLRNASSHETIVQGQKGQPDVGGPGADASGIQPD